MVADLIIHNRTSTSSSRHLPPRSPLKLRLRVPHSHLQDLPKIREQLLEVVASSPTIVQSSKDGMVLGKFTDSSVEFILKVRVNFSRARVNFSRVTGEFHIQCSHLQAFCLSRSSRGSYGILIDLKQRLWVL